MTQFRFGNHSSVIVPRRVRDDVRAFYCGVLGGTLAQGRAAASALEGISRNPGAAARIQTPMILGLALIESLVLFALVVALFLLRKI